MVTTKITRKIKNRISAIPAAVLAIIPNPKRAAIIAIIRNTIDQYNIMVCAS